VRRAAPVVAAVLLAVAGTIALLPFSASATVREPPESSVPGDCRPPVVEAWPSGRDRVQLVTRGERRPAYEAVDGRLHRSCDAPASRRLALSAGLLVPAGLLLATSRRRSSAAERPQR
jgi:hypothetical protein